VSDVAESIELAHRPSKGRELRRMSVANPLLAAARSTPAARVVRRPIVERQRRYDSANLSCEKHPHGMRHAGQQLERDRDLLSTSSGACPENNDGRGLHVADVWNARTASERKRDDAARDEQTGEAASGTAAGRAERHESPDHQLPLLFSSCRAAGWRRRRSRRSRVRPLRNSGARGLHPGAMSSAVDEPAGAASTNRNVLPYFHEESRRGQHHDSLVRRHASETEVEHLRLQPSTLFGTLIRNLAARVTGSMTSLIVSSRGREALAWIAASVIAAG